MVIDFVHVDGNLSVSHILLQMAWRTSTTGCPPCVMSPAGTLSTPAHFRILVFLFHFLFEDWEFSFLCLFLADYYTWIAFVLTSIQ